MLYDVTQDHPLALPRLIALSETQFAAHVMKAEILLGLSSANLVSTVEGVARLQIAVIEQVNFQLQQGLDPLIEESSGTSSQATKSVVWRDRYVNPIAAAIVAVEIPPSEASWGNGGMQSHRTRDGGGHRARTSHGWYIWPMPRIR